MNAAVLQAIFALINNVLPLITSSAGITSLIVTLEQLAPIVIQEGSDLWQPFKNIIAALSPNPAATADQLATLQALDAQIDAAFEAAAAEYAAAHPGTP